MNIMKRCIGVAAAFAVAGTQLFSPDILNNRVIISEAASTRISENGIALIKKFEGYSQYAFWDYSQWTIGYGTGVEKDAYPDGITEQEADRLLRNVVLRYEGYVQTFLDKYNIKVNKNQYDALVSFTYNLGNVWVYTSEVTIRTYLINGIDNYTPQQIRDAFLLWVKAGGVTNAGLVKRRGQEADLFLSDSDFPPVVPAGEQWRITSTTGVRFRNDPTTEADISGVIPYNTTVSVSEKKDSEGFLWGKVIYNGKTGWCVLDYAEHISGDVGTEVIPDIDDKTEKWRIVSQNGVNMRLSYGLSSGVLDVIPFDTIINVYEKVDADGYEWARTVYNNRPGWCVLNYASKITTDSSGNPTLLGIRLEKLPDKLEYSAGELFDSKGMKIIALYSDHTENEIIEYGSSGNTMIPGESTITVDYQGMTISFMVTVNACKGDINKNGTIDTEDYLSVKKYILNNDNKSDIKSDGDLNGDGKIDVFDSINARRKIIGSKIQE